MMPLRTPFPPLSLTSPAYHSQAILWLQVLHRVSTQDGNLGFSALLLTSVMSFFVGFHGVFHEVFIAT